MSTVASKSTSRPDFASFFNAALASYKRKTKKDLALGSPLSQVSVLQFPGGYPLCLSRGNPRVR